MAYWMKGEGIEGFTRDTPSLLTIEEALNGGANTQKSVKKVGRNELCPCGSGKKFKKCCG
jgi:uncharacterized protein YecA (UPF0149 family)